MKRIVQLASVAVLAAAGLAVVPGCQNAHHTDTTDRPAVTSTVVYDRAYVATRDTEWVAAPGSTTRSTLPRGTRVYFADTPGTTEWQQARVEGRGVVWVHPADFVRETK
jgi:hypothetical protein